MTKTLSSGLEDYIEMIYVAQMNDRLLKAADLARIMGISRASVSEALAKLAAKGLVKYESYGTVYLTDEGRREAGIVYNKHSILERFLVNVLGISQPEASEDACRMEHVISQELLNKIHDFTHYAEDNEELFRGIWSKIQK